VTVEVVEEGPGALAAYARVPIAFAVRRVLDVVARDGGLGGLALVERAVDPPWVKDYDALPDGGPTGWAARFDLARWGILAARVDGRRVGGAAIAHDTPGVDMLGGRRDLAVLWDLRVAPEARGRGVGTALVERAAAWAAARGCRLLAVETQNVNVDACRFYARRGFALGAVHRFAYPELPAEAQLVWYRALAAPPGA
jgi:GNAT superfamily N-acetyltransferase